MQITINGQTREVAEGISVASLLEQLQLNSRHLAVEVNEQLVPRARHGDYRLDDGDQLEVVTLVGGG